MSTADSIFASRAFSLFFAGQAFSYIGYGLRLIALPLLVYHMTNSASALGLTYALELLPFAVFGPIGGSLADRLDRRRLMIVADAVRLSVFVLFAVGYVTHTLTLGMLYTGIVVESACAAAFISGQSSSIPYLLGKHRATRAVAALLATEQAAITVLPPLGGALFAVLGPLPALVSTAMTYLISAVSIASVDTFGPDEPSGLPTLRDVKADIAEGFRFLMRDVPLRTTTLLSCAFNFFGFMTGAVFIPFLKRDFGASDVAVGYAFGVGAIGAVVGSYVAGRMPHSLGFGRMLTVAYILDAFLFLPVMFTHRLDVAITFLALTNACVMFEIAQIVGWRTRVTPDGLVGRVFGAARLLALAGTVPGAILGGALADHFGARLPIVASGFGYLVMALLVAAIPAIRNERR
jgi:MFS family permease